MKRNGKRVLFLGSMLIVAFVIWTALIQIVDMKPIGPNGTKIGFSSFNGWFHKLTGVHMTLYIVTDWLGLVPVFICIIFGSIGFIQLVKRKSLFKVDYDIIFLGIYYIVVIVSYLIFEMIPINYRPILIEGRMEASYPSSTTLLVLCVMLTLIEQVNRRLENKVVRKIICIFASCFSMFMIVGRLVSGVHWFTDIVGAVILSLGLFYMYKGIILLSYKEK